MTLTLQHNDRLPAEWEKQDAVLLAWPHEKTDWVSMLKQVEQVYLAVTRQISRFEAVVIVTPEPDKVRLKLQSAGIDLARIHFLQAPTNDTWARDFGPLTVSDGTRTRQLDFTFNGWGNKFPAEDDNQVTARLNQSAIVKPDQRTVIDLVLEGGSIETDGAGTLLTTSRCLLNPNRNPGCSQSEIEQKLLAAFATDHFLWLDFGWLAGDDTDAHIDTLARLCPESTILYVHCDQAADEHYSEFQKMEQQLRRFRTRSGQPFRLLPLPWPQACYDDGERLPATYANYLVINDAVLVPSYEDPADDQALAVIGQAFPEREVIAIDCRPLIRQHGSLHCITMQLPQGVLA